MVNIVDTYVMQDVVRRAGQSNLYSLSIILDIRDADLSRTPWRNMYGYNFAASQFDAGCRETLPSNMEVFSVFTVVRDA